MGSYSLRLVIAAVISAAGIAASFLWYDLTDPKNADTSGKQKIAHLDTTRNEVQKRSMKRVIWQRANEEDPLFSGESVRTGADSEAKIIFENGAEVNLDPDSVVVIQESGDKIALDFVQGNLLVKGGGSGGNFALKSGNAEIDLNNADLSLGKSGSGQGVDVQVLRGSAEISSGDKKMTIDKDKSGKIGEKGVEVTQSIFKIFSPSPGEKVFIRAEKQEPVLFSFAPLGPDYEVQFETGISREALKPFGQSITGDKGEFSVQLKPGIQYWKLVATNKKDPKQIYSTLINKVTVQPEFPAKLLTPAMGETAVINPATKKVTFRWANASRLVRLVVEVSKDQTFKTPVIAEEVKEDTGVRDFDLTEEATYYWRISGFRAGTSKQLVSDVNKFSLRTKLEHKSPDLKMPLADATVPFEVAQNGGLFLSWTPVIGFSKYHVRVTKDGGRTEAPFFDKDVTEATQVRLSGISPGVYRWAVTTLSPEGRPSAPGENRKLIVLDMPRIEWAGQQNQDTYYYVTPKPSLKVSWQKLSVVKKFKVAIYPEGAERAQAKIVDATGDSSPVTEVPKEGLFHAVVEGIDDKGQVVARSNPKDFVVQMKPLLSAPFFAEGTPEVIQARKNGSVNLAWKPVNGAKFYTIQLKGAGGKVKEEKANQATTQIKSLLPGSYKVQLVATDEFGRPGKSSEERTLTVPDSSEVRAPKFKKIQVK